MKDNTKRFSDRVANYTKYRPTYPAAAIDYIVGDFRVTDRSKIADVGSGTGIFTALLAARCGRIYGVEPNAEMRKEADSQLRDVSSFVSVNGTAENTTLEDKSVDFITVAQAFHWFDFVKTRVEFKRILKDQGRVFLVWNKRLADTEFMRRYESILRADISEYREVSHTNVTDEMLQEFLDCDFSVRKFPNAQVHDWAGLIGRFRSSSYTPNESSAAYAAIEAKLRCLFDDCAKDGLVSFGYETVVYSGMMT